MLSVTQCPPGWEDVHVVTNKIEPSCVSEGFTLLKWFS